MRETVSLASSYRRQELPASLMQRLDLMQHLALAASGREPPRQRVSHGARRGAHVVVLAWFSFGVIASGAMGAGAIVGLRTLGAAAPLVVGTPAVASWSHPRADWDTVHVAIDRSQRARAPLALQVTGADDGAFDVVMHAVPVGVRPSRGAPVGEATWVLRPTDSLRPLSDARQRRSRYVRCENLCVDLGWHRHRRQHRAGSARRSGSRGAGCGDGRPPSVALSADPCRHVRRAGRRRRKNGPGLHTRSGPDGHRAERRQGRGATRPEADGTSRCRRSRVVGPARQHRRDLAGGRLWPRRRTARAGAGDLLVADAAAGLVALPRWPGAALIRGKPLAPRFLPMLHRRP